MTGALLTWRDFAQIRSLQFAYGHGMRAARMKMATGRRIERARDFTRNRLEDALACSNPWHLGHQGLRIGMIGSGKYLGSRTFLHNSAQIHDDDTICEMADHAQVVADEQVGEIEPSPQINEKVQDLRLDRDIKRRYGLVADQQVGLQCQRPGNADALPLAAAELMRIAMFEGR